MVKVGTKAAKDNPLHIRSISPGLPDDADEILALDRDLKRMGCKGFRKRPWSFKDKDMVRELVTVRSNKWDHTVRADPTKWTEELWREVYKFRAEGEGMCSRKESFVEGAFKRKADPKYRFTVANCRDPGARRVMEFLVPILYPDKPAKTTTMLANTILGVYLGARPVAWAGLVQEVVAKLVIGIRKPRPSFITPFLNHLYKHNGLLKDEEETTYEMEEVLDSHGWEKDKEPDVEATPESGSEEPKQDPNPAKRSGKRQRKTTERSEATPPSRQRKAHSDTEESDPIATAIEEIVRAKEGYEAMFEILTKLCKLTGVVEADRLYEEIEKKLLPYNIQVLKARM
jgi:hypothetical protein